MFIIIQMKGLIYMLKFYKNQKGITLVALVITIIILLILAGVGIVNYIGKNGFFTQTSNLSTSLTISRTRRRC